MKHNYGNNANQSAAGTNTAVAKSKKSNAEKIGAKLPRKPRNAKVVEIVMDAPPEVEITEDYYLDIRLPQFAATKISLKNVRPMAQQQRRVRLIYTGGKARIQYYNASDQSKTLVQKLLRDHLPANHVKRDGPVEVHVAFYFKLPVRPAGKKVGDPYDKKIDLDNLQKLIFDAMTGIVYGDDSMICRMSAEKVYGDFDGTTVYITKP